MTTQLLRNTSKRLFPHIRRAFSSNAKRSIVPGTDTLSDHLMYLDHMMQTTTQIEKTMEALKATYAKQREYLEHSATVHRTDVDWLDHQNKVEKLFEKSAAEKERISQYIQQLKDFVQEAKKISFAVDAPDGISDDMVKEDLKAIQEIIDKASEKENNIELHRLHILEERARVDALKTVAVSAPDGTSDDEFDHEIEEVENIIHYHFTPQDKVAIKALHRHAEIPSVVSNYGQDGMSNNASDSVAPGDFVVIEEKIEDIVTSPEARDAIRNYYADDEDKLAIIELQKRDGIARKEEFQNIHPNSEKGLPDEDVVEEKLKHTMSPEARDVLENIFGLEDSEEKKLASKEARKPHVLEKVEIPGSGNVDSKKAKASHILTSPEALDAITNFYGEDEVDAAEVAHFRAMEKMKYEAPETTPDAEFVPEKEELQRVLSPEARDVIANLYGIDDLDKQHAACMKAQKIFEEYLAVEAAKKLQVLDAQDDGEGAQDSAKPDSLVKKIEGIIESPEARDQISFYYDDDDEERVMKTIRKRSELTERKDLEQLDLEHFDTEPKFEDLSELVSPEARDAIANLYGLDEVEGKDEKAPTTNP